MKPEDKSSGQRQSVMKAVGRASGPDRQFLDRLKERSLMEFENAPAATPEAPAAGPGKPWRIPMKSRVFKIAAAAAVIAVAAIIGARFVGGTNAYAQFVEEIKNARTVVYTLIRQSNTGDGSTIKVDVAYKEPGFMRTTTPDGYIAILNADSGKMISIVPQGGYTIADLASVTAVKDPGPFATIEALKALPAKADQSLGSKDVDGTACNGYQVSQGDLTTRVWLRTDTGDLVEVEHQYTSAPGMNTLMKHIKLDVPLEDSLFSLTPPAGYKPLGTGTMTSNAAAETEGTFVAWLRWWANANVDETFPPMVLGSEIAKVSMDMMKQGKFKSSAWDKVSPNEMFSALLFVAKLPKESNWRYAGNGVKVNTPDTPIFWYRPAGGQTYRVVYADLTVHQVAEDRLPK